MQLSIANMTNTLFGSQHNIVICTVGANKGQGFGFNELYLTRSDGVSGYYSILYDKE
jgi:hypothetical protein